MTFFTFSLGCKVNSYECAALAGNLRKNGFIESKNNPDIVIINTCSVTSTADQKSRQHIRKFKHQFPNAIIVVMGCYAQGNYEFIKDEIKADIIVGTSHRDSIIKYINQFLKTKQKIVDVDINPRLFKYEELGITSYSENIRAYLKVGDGCNNFCSYCLIPYRRGALRSRDPKNIILEAEYLTKLGYKEIVLTGIHVGGFGKDNDSMLFSDLVETLLDIPGLPRLRISSIEMSEVDDKLIYLLKNRKNLAKHLHIPLQSGCDETLKRMNRKYSCDEFLNKCKKIRKEIPDICLSTDVIVGFPGETEEEFNKTKDFILKSGINMIHVFPYSSREGTLAVKMKDQINPIVKRDRCRDLISLSKSLYEKFVNKFIGKDVEVLVERYDDEKKLNIGHTSNYIEVSIPSDEGKENTTTIVKLQKDMI